MVSNERVEEILKESGVLLNGHFLLASGKHSDRYLQCARVLQYPGFSEELISIMADAFKDEKIDAVIGPATGGIIIAYELARQLKTVNLFTERVEGKMALRRSFELKKGARVVIAEDVITTGGSVFEVIEIAKEYGCEIVGVGVLVDRSNGTIDFGTKLVSCYKTFVEAYEADNCPVCKEGKIPVVKPGTPKAASAK